jgi:hypothetical protein
MDKKKYYSKDVPLTNSENTTIHVTVKFNKYIMKKKY